MSGAIAKAVCVADGGVNGGKQLDYALAFVLIGSTDMPIGHIALKLLFKSVREKREAEKAAE